LDIMKQSCPSLYLSVRLSACQGNRQAGKRTDKQRDRQMALQTSNTQRLRLCPFYNRPHSYVHFAAHAHRPAGARDVWPTDDERTTNVKRGGQTPLDPPQAVGSRHRKRPTPPAMVSRQGLRQWKNSEVWDEKELHILTYRHTYSNKATCVCESCPLTHALHFFS